ncbi:hypothetical protein [Alicyclobacillus macrosporangiidus]|uniref:hypothetical protein n=1 Tax=Alicyclobacillus macrosporangiidus TaxID=392015 RepID=UPI0004960069|nr:hypothetical protein [Alicyclobacillus macrosporangiidus]
MHPENSQDSFGQVYVVGLGFVGLPLAMQFWNSGLRVTGLDIDLAKISLLQLGTSYLPDIRDHDVARPVQSGALTCIHEFATVTDVDTIIACVPTPLKGCPALRWYQ